MSNKEEKYTVDDILEEYDRVNAVTKETVEDVSEEEYDNYEDCEAQELSTDNFATERPFEPTELFGAGSVPSMVVQENGDVIINEDESDDAADEEIFLDEAEDGDDVEITEEIIETESEAGEDSEEKIFEIHSAETSDENEPEIDFQSGELPEISEWTDAGVPEEIREVSNDAAIDVLETAVAAEPEKKENTDITEISTEEDVNEKFMNRLLKGIFPWKGDSIGEIIRKIIFLLAVIVFVGAGVMLVSTLLQSRAALNDKNEAKNIITTTVATAIDENGNVVEIAPTDDEVAEHIFNVAEHYKSINEDYVGYFELEGCDIYEPVMQGDDNDYYLTHNYYGGTNKAGTVFMDYRCLVESDYVSPNIVLYGHNQEDGTMFGNLKEYKQNVDFYKENPVVKFTTEYETNEYLIYGYFVTHVRPEQHSSGEVFHYHDYIEVLNDEYTFNWYVNEVQKRNQIVSPVDVEYGDKLLCLSTCSNEFSDSRFVVFARMLRDGESVDDYDFSEAYMNYNAQGVDWDAIMSGETTTIPENAVNNKKKNRNEITAEITRAETAETKAAETDAEETETPAETEVPVSEETSEAVTETAAS